MEGIWQIGSLIIHKEWVVILVAVILSSSLLPYLYDLKEDKEQMKECVTNALFIFIVSYQLSSFLFHYSLTFSYPLTVLAVPGTWKEWVVAWILASIYMFVTTKKNNISFFSVALYSFLVYVITEILYLGYQVYSQSADPALFTHMSIMNVLVFIFLLGRNNWTRKSLLYSLLILFGTAMTLYGLAFPGKMLFLYVPSPVFIGVTVLSVVGILVSWFRRKR